MEYNIKCKNDCCFNDNGQCRMNLTENMSIFPAEQHPCIYYSQNLNKRNKKYNLF